MTADVRRRLGTTLLVFCVLAGLTFNGEDVAAEAGRPRVHVVSFGLFGMNNLFQREATAAADVIAEHYGHSGQVIVRANTEYHSAAQTGDLRYTLRGLVSTIDRNQDILFLFLTSHGSQKGLAVGTNDDRRTVLLSPGQLRELLVDTGIRYRVVIISACFAGVFADEIADDYTLVIAAADANHTSFGCSDSNPGNYTYFGEAFFGESFRPGVNLDEAFARAKIRVTAREAEEHLTGSNPQMKGGAAVRAQLAKLEQPISTHN
jgi:hypothetical protein